MKALISILFFVSFAYAETDVEFVFDVSGSMAKQLNGEAQIDIARKALINNLKEIPSDQLVAVRVFAHRVEQTNKAESCKDTELLVPFAKADIGSIALAMASLSPKGYTPIAYSLERAAEDMIAAGKTREPERVIILLSDGEETCDGDPIAVLQRLKDQGFKVIVHTIGFNVNDIARKQLQDIANFTGGKFFDATDATKLGDAFEEATKETYLIEKNKEELDLGIKVRGGDGFQSAVEFKKEWVGQDLRLDHHQKKGDFDYFYIDLKSADIITLTVKNLDKGIIINKDGNVLESKNNSYTSIFLHDAQYDKVKSLTVYSDFESKEESLYLGEEKRFYLLFGGSGTNLHMDSSIFKVSIEQKGDLNTNQDAGETNQTSLEIKEGSYQNNFLGGRDKKDVFKLLAKKGEQYSLTYLPSSQESAPIFLIIADGLNIKIPVNTRGGRSGEGLSAQFTIPQDGVYYIQIGSYGNRESEYSLELVKKSALELVKTGSEE